MRDMCTRQRRGHFEFLPPPPSPDRAVPPSLVRDLSCNLSEMRRPLQDLPLDHFLQPNPDLPNPSNSRPNKRPFSPGGPTLYSPAKRRILSEEGIFPPAKPWKSPISIVDGPELFAHVLSGPQSPAKILNFGTPRCRKGFSSINFTPNRPTTRSVTRLATSPEFKSLSHPPSRQLGADQEIDDYFSGTPGPSQPPKRPKQSTLPPVDFQSIHYPGFRVYRDKRTTLHTQEIDSSNTEDDSETDDFKENILPRKKLANTVHLNPGTISRPLPLEEKTRDAEKRGKGNSTPKKIFGMDKFIGSPTPRRALRGVQSGPWSTEKSVLDKRRRTSARVSRAEGREGTLEG